MTGGGISLDTRFTMRCNPARVLCTASQHSWRTLTATRSIWTECCRWETTEPAQNIFMDRSCMTILALHLQGLMCGERYLTTIGVSTEVLKQAGAYPHSLHRVPARVWCAPWCSRFYWSSAPNRGPLNIRLVAQKARLVNAWALLAAPSSRYKNQTAPHFERSSLYASQV